MARTSKHMDASHAVCLLSYCVPNSSSFVLLTSLRAHARAHTHTHFRTHTHTHAHTHARTHAHVHWHTRTGTHAHTHKHARARAHADRHARARRRARTRTRMPVVGNCVWLIWERLQHSRRLAMRFRALRKKYHGTGTKAAGAAPAPPHLNVGDLHAVYCAAEMVLFSAALDPHAPPATLRCGGAGAAPSPMPSVSGWLFFSQCTECICLAWPMEAPLASSCASSAPG